MKNHEWTPTLTKNLQPPPLPGVGVVAEAEAEGAGPRFLWKRMMTCHLNVEEEAGGVEEAVAKRLSSWKQVLALSRTCCPQAVSDKPHSEEVQQRRRYICEFLDSCCVYV